ncbi:hypothetical protein ACLOJK_007991 [Asimina triloba]
MGGAADGWSNGKMEMGHLAGTGGLLATCVRVLLAVCGRDGAVAGGDGFGSWKREEDGCRLLDRDGSSSTNGDEVAPWLFARAEGRPDAAGPSSIAVDVDDGDGFWGRKRLDFWMEQMGMMVAGSWRDRGPPVTVHTARRRRAAWPLAAAGVGEDGGQLLEKMEYHTMVLRQGMAIWCTFIKVWWLRGVPAMVHMGCMNLQFEA